MIVSALAMMASLGTAQNACAQDIACIAAPDQRMVMGKVPWESGAILNLPGPASLAMQDTPPTIPRANEPPDPAGATAAEPVDPGNYQAEENVIVVEGEVGPPRQDPAEQVNAATYKAAQAVDVAVVEPVAQVYDKGLPKPLRDGVGNFLSNLGEPVNFINSLLQLKPGKALKSLGRFAINTTLGIGGLFDHASKQPFSIERERNGFANTLGYYGVGPGPYLYLPLIGPTTLRDLTGRFVDLSVVPAVAGPPFNDPYYAIPLGALHSLEDRVQMDAQIDAIREQCGDPYAATRDIYLLQRQARINQLRGKPVKDLSEIAERLEFNCDIEVFSAVEVDDGEDYVGQHTSLLKQDEGEGEAGPATSDEIPAGESPDHAQPEANIPGDPHEAAADDTVAPIGELPSEQDAEAGPATEALPLIPET